MTLDKDSWLGKVSEEPLDPDRRVRPSFTRRRVQPAHPTLSHSSSWRGICGPRTTRWDSSGRRPISARSIVRSVFVRLSAQSGFRRSSKSRA